MENEMTAGGFVEALGGLVALFVIAYLIAVDAGKKGRSGWAWGLLCFFTCLIAVPIYFLVISKEKGE